MDSFICWVGGKRLLRKKIISIFPQSGIKRYIEVFGGAGWVLFGKKRHAPFEVYNDLDGELVNLFRCVKYHREELQRQLRFTLNARETLCDFRSQMKAEGLTDIQRAARFFILIKISYGGDRHSFGCVTKNMEHMTGYLEMVSERLSRVVIEHKSYESLIPLYDTESSLFYLDPPYHTTEKYYEAKFTEADHEKLRGLLRKIKGKFVLSYNDDEFIRSLYEGYDILPISRSNNLLMRDPSANQKFREVLIKNF